MELREILLVNLKEQYGNLAIASEKVNVSAFILQNWANNYSYPNLQHLNTISFSSKINGSYWIREDLIKVSNRLVFTQDRPLYYYFQKNINELMINSGKRRRNLFSTYHDGITDIMSPDTFDDYRFGRTLAVPLYRLEELGYFFECSPYKLIEVKANDKES